ncbi:MAG TPA: DinB family protein [Dehalococcoidia bacterium]
MADQAAIDELFRKLEEERARFMAQAEALSEEAAALAPQDAEGEAQWSAKEQFAHMCEMEAMYRAWIRACLHGENPDLSGVRPDRSEVEIPLEQAQAEPLARHLAALRRARARTLELLRTIPPDGYDRTGTHPMFGTLTVMQWARSYYRHDRMHYDQIAGREPEYRPRYAGGREPDQRRRAAPQA